MIDGKTKILGVLGDPIEHTKSPAIHNALLKDCGINAVYLPFAVPVSNLSVVVGGFSKLSNFLGANVTIPFKEKIIPFLDEISAVSKATGSVNTIYYRDGKLCGTSTDGLGALRNLQKSGVSLEGKRVALLGSGGAAKALAYAFLNGENELKCAKSLEVFYGKKEELIGVLENYPNAKPLSEFENCIGEFDVVCNATPLGMHPNLAQSPVRKELLHPNLTVFDIVYNPLETQLLKDAAAAGCKVVGGIGMLVYQAVESFKLWFPEAKVNAEVAFSAIGLSNCNSRESEDKGAN